MSDTDLGPWLDAIDGRLSEEEGFRLLERLAREPQARAEWLEARRLWDSLAAARAGSGEVPPTGSEETELAVAEALASGRVPASFWRSEETIALAAASLRSLHDGSKPGTGPADGSPPLEASETTRARLAAAAGLARAAPRARVRRRPLGRSFAGIGALAAAIGLAVFSLTPPRSGWAGALGVRRAALWLMPDAFAADVARAWDTGVLAPAPFDTVVAAAPPERDLATGPEPPAPITPRWEAVASPRPTFSWTPPSSDRGEAGARDEVLLVDASRQVLWRAEGRQGRLDYPAGELPLEPGARYFWRVVRTLPSGERVASTFAGIVVLEPERARACSTLARRYAGRPFLRGVALDRCGMLSPAAEAFARAAETLDDPGPARRALAALARKRGVAEDDL